MFLTLRKNFQEMFPEDSWGTKNGGSMAKNFIFKSVGV